MAKSTRTSTESRPPQKAPASRPLSALTKNDADRVVARVKGMTKEEFIQSLKDCGVLTKSGKLAKRYRG